MRLVAKACHAGKRAAPTRAARCMAWRSSAVGARWGHAGGTHLTASMPSGHGRRAPPDGGPRTVSDRAGMSDKRWPCCHSSLRATCSGVCRFLVVIIIKPSCHRVCGKTLTQPGSTSSGHVTSGRRRSCGGSPGRQAAAVARQDVASAALAASESVGGAARATRRRPPGRPGTLVAPLRSWCCQR